MASTAFTRTLTTMYSLTLLTLFTHVQLNVLGRSKYISSVVQLARDESEREQLQDALSLSNLLSGRLPETPSGDDILDLEPVGESTERKYLTLSWYIMNLGWKDVGERVSRAVEEVFEG